MKVRARLLSALLLGAALAAVTVLPATPAFAQEKAEKGPKNSPGFAKPLKDANEALKAKNYSDAIAKLKAAENLPGKTPGDQYIIDEMLSFAYIKTQQYPEAAKYMEAKLDSGLAPQSEQPTLVKQLATIYYQTKTYDKAIEYGNRAIKGGYADDQIKTIVGQSYYLKGDWKNTLKFEQDIVNSQIKAGQTPTLESLQLIYSACTKMQDESCQTRAMEQLVQYYPKPEEWAQLLYGMRRETSGNEANLFQTYRLMLDTDVLKDPGDYTEMAELALDAGSPGDAQSVLEKAQEKNVFTDQRSKDRSQRLLESAKKRATADQAGLPKLEKEADAAATGDKNIAVGRAYLGYGQYDKAVDQLSKGLTKGGVKNEADARLTLGIAQLKAGHKDDAVKTFKAVKGDPALERLANLWSLRAKQGSTTAVSQTQAPKKGKGAKSHQSPKVARRQGG
ncbi:MAG TPA: tetratricopeptide repeat protein [Steroidobacteraceae bacterium]|nr:tetratricopeptide repeat protein [Steroidobacteraceae bacterium]